MRICVQRRTRHTAAKPVTRRIATVALIALAATASASTAMAAEPTQGAAQGLTAVGVTGAAAGLVAGTLKLLGLGDIVVVSPNGNTWGP
ncbi:hypothetical protein [Streptomyces sp. NPDC059452]|uniref:hypothetical protein n=1 Tax=Streptomyces sp. NPDC059452 TaxID=3346835 RepID=UPI003681D44F